MPVLEILSDPEEELEEDSGEDSEQDPEEPVPVASSGASGGGPSWLLKSGSESSHQFQLEWMTDSHC